MKVTVGLVDQLSSKIDKIKNKFPELGKKVSGVHAQFQALQESTKGFRESVEKFSDAVAPKMKSIGKAMTVGITLPVVAAAGYSIKKFMDFEKALNEVQGSTDLSGASLQAFGQQMLALSTKTTFSQDELLGLAAAAGEAGVRGSEDLGKFALTLAQLQKTANLAGPDTAEALFRILTLTKEGVGSVGNFGSALTALENQYGVKASKILESTEMMSRELGQFGLTSTQLAGLATAMVPLGFEAKQASTAVGEAFRGIDDAIRKGGVKMEGLQRITGMTGDELKEQFQKNPQAVFESFLNGLNTIESKGGQTAEALAFFGASGDKTGVILKGLAKDTKALSAVQALARDEFNKNTALTNEYGETTTTLSASLAKFKNNTDALSISLGNRLAPFITMAANALSGLMRWFNEHPTIATFVAVLAGLLAIVGPILVGLGSFIAILPGLITGINLLTGANIVLGTSLWAALAPVLIIMAKFILIIAIIAAVIAVIWIFRDAIKNGLVAAWDWVIEKIYKVIDLMKQVTGFLSQGILKYTPMGALAYGANKALNMIPGQAASGEATNAAPVAADAAVSQFATQTNNAKVDINVRAPQSTMISSEQGGSFLNINRGMAGVF